VLTFIERPALVAASPTPLLVLLHGYGATEEDLAWLAHQVDPRVRVVLPRAPIRVPDVLGYQWYDPKGLGHPDEAELKTSLLALSALLAHLSGEDGGGRTPLLLGGFSQGGLMTAAYGARRLRPRPSALLILSGYLPPDQPLPDLEGLPVFLGHGTDDPVINVAWGLGLAHRLERAGARVEVHTYPGGHGLHPTELTDVLAFIRRQI